jgi:hypothetical protein
VKPTTTSAYIYHGSVFKGKTTGGKARSNLAPDHRRDTNGGKKSKGSKLHMAVDTLGLLLVLRVTAANEQELHKVEQLAEIVQEVI